MKFGELEFNIEELERIWFTDQGLLLSSVVLLAAGFWLGSIIPVNGENKLFVSLCITDLFLTIGYFFWRFSRRFPKVEKGKVGIIIAIRDNTPEAEKIKKDVVDKFKEITENLPIGNKICVLIVNDFISKQITNIVSADKILDGCRGHFIIFGRTLNYKVKESDQYEFDLTFKVRHRPLDIRQKTVIQQHFDEAILSKQWHFLEENPFTIIKVTANNIREIALYVIGMASFFSFDFKTSLDFHETVYSLLNADRQKRDDLDVVYKRLKNYMADSKMFRGLQAHYESPNDQSAQNSALKANEEALNLIPNHYPALVNKAKYLFQLGDIAGAKDVIRIIKRMNSKHPSLVQDASWRYSDGFLLFYEGKFDRGRSAYKKAFSRNVTEFTLDGVINFLTDYLLKNPSAIQFYYPLGMIYYFKLANITMALKEFQSFLNEIEGKSEYDFLKQEVEGYKLAIEREIDQASEIR